MKWRLIERGTRPAPCRYETTAAKGFEMSYSIFYIIGIVVVIALVLAFLF